MSRADADPVDWQLLVKFFFAQREHLPSMGEEFELSPIQCHVLQIEPERVADGAGWRTALRCDASDVTGLVDRLGARRLVQRRPSADDRRVKVISASSRPRDPELRAQPLGRMTGARALCPDCRPASSAPVVEILEALRRATR